MKEPFSFGTPERRRFAMQFGYDTRPSFWQGIQSNSHLVIAVVGTAALLGVAAVALWLALPANERQAIASAEQTVPTVPVKTMKVATIPVATTIAAATLPQANRKADKVSPAAATAAASKAVITTLASNDPRWTGSGSKPPSGTTDTSPAPQPSPTAQAADKPAAAAAFAEPPAGTNASTELAKVAAPDNADTSDSADGAQTAAIPEVQPVVPPQPAATGDTDSQAKPHKAAAVGTGRILRPVTMRSGPKTNAAAITTVPAKTSVQLVSCKQWCEIVYNGKHGWVYKSYIKPGA
ncbi:SH3 domain-containing protein [Mesorhizobium sp.]|uniref:SH3 domain-containing protein n=1 Tax=Mesorhizobium sp. TaxID=1871066 RepID=UPI003BAB59D4